MFLIEDKFSRLFQSGSFILNDICKQKMDFLTLDKTFVLDNLNFVQDKIFFVQADGRGIRMKYWCRFIALSSIAIMKNLTPLNLKYYLHSHRCPWFRPCFCNSVIPSFRHTFEFYRKRPPGGARQNPRSGFFLVTYKEISCWFKIWN